jgi:hypothetical protein
VDGATLVLGRSGLCKFGTGNGRRITKPVHDYDYAAQAKPENRRALGTAIKGVNGIHSSESATVARFSVSH